MSVITSASKALKVANELTGSQGTSSNTGVHKGRTFKHWSFYVLLGGGLVGLVATIAASILTMYPLIACGVVLFVTSSVGAYYIRKFDTFNELEDYVEEMSNKILDLSKIIKDLKKINKEFKDTRKRFEADIEKDEKIWNDGDKKVRKSAEEIKRLTKSLDVTTKKLKKMEELYSNLQNAVNIFSNHVVGINENNKDMSNKIDKLANNVTDAKAVIESFDCENDEFDENNELYENLNKANLAFLTKFQEELEKIYKIQYSAKELKESLEKQSAALHEVTLRIQNSINKTEEYSKEEAAIKKENRRMLKKAEKMAEALTRIVNCYENPQTGCK